MNLFNVTVGAYRGNGPTEKKYYQSIWLLVFSNNRKVNPWKIRKLNLLMFCIVRVYSIHEIPVC